MCVAIGGITPENCAPLVAAGAVEIGSFMEADHFVVERTAGGDVADEAAALDAARRWKQEGQNVRIARPPTGMDFNDLLLGRAAGVKEGAA